MVVVRRSLSPSQRPINAERRSPLLEGAVATDVCLFSATELLDSYKRKLLSPVEVVDAVARRIEELNPKLNAYCQLRLDEASVEAKRSERELMERRDLRPLLGVPVSIKDMTAIAGM